MRRYHTRGVQTLTASPGDSTLSLQSTAAVRPRVYHFVLSCETDAQDVQILWHCQRFATADGTGSAYTPQPLDPGDPAAVTVAQTNHTVEPTYTANEFMFGPKGINSRATFTWVAAHPGAEIVLPAVATEGVGWVPIHASNTSEVSTTAYFWE